MKLEDFKDGAKHILKCQNCGEFHPWLVGRMQYGDRVMLHLDMEDSPCGSYGMLAYPNTLVGKTDDN